MGSTIESNVTSYLRLQFLAKILGAIATYTSALITRRAHRNSNFAYRSNWHSPIHRSNGLRNNPKHLLHNHRPCAQNDNILHIRESRTNRLLSPFPLPSRPVCHERDLIPDLRKLPGRIRDRKRVSKGPRSRRPDLFRTEKPQYING